MSSGRSANTTSMCERMSLRLEKSGARHPVAGAVALAARGHLGLGREEFAKLVGVELADVIKTESGRVPFGRLPQEIDWVLADIKGLDLLVLAHMARATRCGASVDACQHGSPCSDAP